MSMSFFLLPFENGSRLFCVLFPYTFSLQLFKLVNRLVLDIGCSLQLQNRHLRFAQFHANDLKYWNNISTLIFQAIRKNYDNVA